MGKYFNANKEYFVDQNTGTTSSAQQDDFDKDTEDSKDVKESFIKIDSKHYTIKKAYSKTIGYVKKQD